MQISVERYNPLDSVHSADLSEGKYDLPHGHDAAMAWTFTTGDKRYGMCLIKMMEWTSPLVEQVLGWSSSFN